MKTDKTIKTKTAARTPAAATTALVTESKRPASVTAAPATASAVSRHEITSDIIAARAYTIWEQQGRPNGNDLAHWLLAERQLKQEIRSFGA